MPLSNQTHLRRYVVQVFNPSIGWEDTETGANTFNRAKERELQVVRTLGRLTRIACNRGIPSIVKGGA